MSDRVANLLDLQLHVDEEMGAPPGHRFGSMSLTDRFGAAATGMSVYEIEPGQSTWPYHFELTEEEWLIVIAGEVVLRGPEGEQRLGAGDVMCFQAGAPGGHAVRNDSDTTARFAMPSTIEPYGGGTVYPDTGKFRLSGPGFRHRGYLGDEVQYWDGER